MTPDKDALRAAAQRMLDHHDYITRVRGESAEALHCAEASALRAALAAAEAAPPKTYNYQMGYEAGRRDAAKDPKP